MPAGLMLDAGDGVHRFLTTDRAEAERSAVCVYRAGSTGLVSNLRPIPPRPPRPCGVPFIRRVCLGQALKFV